MSFFTHLLDFLFPSTCPECDTEVSAVCVACMKYAPRAKAHEEFFIYALFDYRFPALRNAIWRFKYKHARNVAEFFARPLHEEIIGTLADRLDVSTQEQYLLVPIPLHHTRLRERGYNQSELLAQAVATYANDKMFQFAPETLVRVRKTKPQARTESRKTRFKNLQGAFKVSGNANVLGRTIMLIDDVATTGATLSEARKVLLASGARQVVAFTLAH